MSLIQSHQSWGTYAAVISEKEALQKRAKTKETKIKAIDVMSQNSLAEYKKVFQKFLLRINSILFC